MNKKYDNLDEYKMAVLSDCIKSTDIMKKITLPQSVYKYRRFDVQYLKEPLERIIIPENRYVEYLGKKDVFTNDFSHLM